jgi:hypothetical protein
MGHQVAGPKLAEGRNLSIATMWAQGSSDRLKLDSRWDVKRGLEDCTGRSAKSKDVKACAEEGLRGAETALDTQGRRVWRSFGLQRWKIEVWGG